MKIHWLVGLRLTGLLIAICLAVSACNKTPSLSPEAARQNRLDWNLKTLVGAYEDNGDTDAKWDESATNALTEFARARASVTDADEPVAEIISTNVAAAVHAGCDDPMINYLFIKYAMAQTNSKEAFVKAFSKMAKDMNQSGYPPIRKFYAAARTLDQIFYAYGTNSFRQPVETETMPLLNNSLNATLADKTMPAQEAYEVADLILSLMGGGTNFYEQTYHCVEKPLFENWPEADTTWLLKGSAYIHMAWDARGNGYADTVSDEAGKLFDERLATAEDALEHAWKLNPKDLKIPLQMMSVMLGQGGGRDRMELWFNRAMELDPNNYTACHDKLYYLEPKWYGSDEDQLAFGRECVQSKKWGGQVPLILVDAHVWINARLDKSEQAAYWKRTDVWADIQSAYDRFFELNPDAIGYYHNYAWYACHAEQWDKLNALIPKLGPVNYAFFGGRDEFDKMVQLARQHTNDPK